MNETAKILNEIINIYGFGCEFNKEELASNFDNIDHAMESLIENNLVELNQLSGKYYLTDIFTCNTFLSQYLKEEEKETQEPINKDYIYEIKKEHLIEFACELKGFEKDIKHIEVKSNVDTFTIDLKIKIREDMISKFENALSQF